MSRFAQMTPAQRRIDPALSKGLDCSHPPSLRFDHDDGGADRRASYSCSRCGRLVFVDGTRGEDGASDRPSRPTRPSVKR